MLGGVPMRHIPALALAAALAFLALRAGPSRPGPAGLALFSFAVSALRGRL